MQPKVSVFIPVYQESELLEDSIKVLIKDPYKNKEIFVVIDEPTENGLETVEKYKRKVKFILNGERKGKVNALNEAVRLSKGEVLLFLDADVKIPKYKSFLQNVVKEINWYDLLEIKKKITGSSLLSRLVHYDYTILNFISMVHSEVLERCIGLNGAAFAIRKDAFYELGKFKKVILEDLEMGTNSFLKNKRFKYANDIEVLNKGPTSWSQWFTQRKRWCVGFAIWLKTHYKSLIKSFLKQPFLLLPYTFFSIPFLCVSFAGIFLSTTTLEKFILVPAAILSSKFSILIPWIVFASLGLVLAKNALLAVLSFFVFSIIFYFISNRLNHRFNLAEFFVYFFFYCPILILIGLASFIRVFIFSKYSLEDWKV